MSRWVIPVPMRMGELGLTWASWRLGGFRSSPTAGPPAVLLRWPYAYLHQPWP